MWNIIESGPLPPASIMAKDLDLLHRFESNFSDAKPALHFYDWEGNCLTYGYFIQPSDHLDIAALESGQIKMARRPTGGGIIFHLTDFAFSVLIPAGHKGYSTNTLENYAFVNERVGVAISQFSSKKISPQLYVENGGCNKIDKFFCMANPTQYDLIVNKKKVGGAAQRRTRWGYLHQGTIALALPPLDLLQKVLKNQDLIDLMQKNTHPLLGHPSTEAIQINARKELKSLLTESLLRW